MTPRPQTIQIFLPGGDPRGLRIAELTTRIVQVIEVPRSLLDDFAALPESKQVAVYFLIGASEDTGAPTVYIGQTGTPIDRLLKHHKEKDFWERALVLVSRTNSLTQTHGLYLERYCIERAAAADRFEVVNKNDGTTTHTPGPLKAECDEIFETGQTLLATLGYPLFDAVGQLAPTGSASAPATSSDNSNIVYTCTGPDAQGRGIYTPEGFVVLKDSTGRREFAPGMRGSGLETFRDELISQGVLRVQGSRVQFTRDHLFGSPSRAAGIVLARSANGWGEWKAADGRTLNLVIRGDARPSGDA